MNNSSDVSSGLTSSSPLIWITAGLGVTVVVLGIVCLFRKQVPFRWLRTRYQWRSWGWAQILIGLNLVLDTVPRLMGGSAGIVIGLIVLGLALMAGAAMVLWRSERA
jgi:hypothetical protein